MIRDLFTRLLGWLHVGGYVATMHRDGLAGSWGGHAVVSVLVTLSGVLLAWAGPGLLSLAAFASACALLVAWGEGSLPLVVLAVPSVALAWWLSFSPVEGGLFGATDALLFYWYREDSNKRSLLAKGAYTPEKRGDRVGDLVGAATNYGGTLVMYLATII